MPQIANQDYNVIAPRVAVSAENDAAACGQIVANIERGTIFDCLILRARSTVENDFLGRVIGVYTNEDGLPAIYTIGKAPNGSSINIYIGFPYTSRQYLSLAKLQEQGNIETVPYITTTDSGDLAEGRTNVAIVCDGRYIVPAYDGDRRLASWNFGGVAQPGSQSYELTEEDLNNLIGVFVD